MEKEEQRKEVQSQLVDRECKLSRKWFCLRHCLFSAYFALEENESIGFSLLLLFTSLIYFKDIVFIILNFVCIKIARIYAHEYKWSWKRFWITDFLQKLPAQNY